MDVIILMGGDSPIFMFGVPCGKITETGLLCHGVASLLLQIMLDCKEVGKGD